MKAARSSPHVSTRWYRPVERACPFCHRTVREALTLTRRTVITLQSVIKRTHVGSRCPERQCPEHQRTYRSAEADALALPHLTDGLDMVLLVGRLRLREHRTVDEVHQELLRRLEPLGVNIARREILSLFEAYGTLLKASREAKKDQVWLAQVKKNGGIIVSIDGIPPEKGNETVDLVRDALTGRVLVAENVLVADTATMKRLLAPVVARDVKRVGTITDAQESEVLAVEQLWPTVPHQVCQFHVLRDASTSAFEADRKMKTAMRTSMQPKMRAVRQQLQRDSPQAEPAEAEHLALLDDDATGVLTALNRDGTTPFDFAAVQAQEDLDEIEASLQRLEKKGEPYVRVVLRNAPASKPWWENGPPGQSRLNRSNACAKGFWMPNISWMGVGHRLGRS